MAIDRDAVVALSDTALMAAAMMDRYRASGPGGQKRNKTESAVRLRHVASGISAHSSDSRSQHENRAKALDRLRENLAFDLRIEVDAGAPGAAAVALATRPGKTTARERLTPGYLIAMAQVLDLLAACEASIGDAARALGVTTGALAKLLTQDERALRRANEMRAKQGLKPLR